MKKNEKLKKSILDILNSNKQEHEYGVVILEDYFGHIANEIIEVIEDEKQILLDNMETGN